MVTKVEGFTCTEVVGMYRIENSDTDTPRDMCVAVEETEAGFVAHCNYSLKTGNMAGSYQSQKPSKTKEEALESLLNGFVPEVRKDPGKVSWEPQKPILGG